MGLILRKFTAATAAFLLSNLWGLAMADENPYTKRSATLLPVTLKLDGNVTDALARKSLSTLQDIYRQLQEETEKGEELVNNNGTASACDVAHSNLLIVVGFAINKLDGEGRYQDWMENESLEKLAEYRELVAACSNDARLPAFSKITDNMIKQL
ncbi:hypothetical protein [Agrobacterium vitis]|uniref:Uncharacterized protein n=1 Tax=Agrobacterium vitis TaxID=373 RepID=A0ABW9TEN7_AGRVI|nr:hypothetical protein [Agrobacterium vitis]MUO43006.1 hypothetical protein [Agrobacterium vitis]